MIEQAGQPLLYTHGGVRRFTRTERGISDDQLAEVRRSGGIVGICPSEDEMNPTTVPPSVCGGAGCPQSCDWGLPGFVVQFSAAAEAVGAANVFVGTDFNGALPHLHPSCGTGTDLDQQGLWNIGQMPQFWEAARKLGAPVPARLSEQMDVFLDHWSRVPHP
jgi:microsomal dipeptidase-like Zn-dependent dipeptidase